MLSVYERQIRSKIDKNFFNHKRVVCCSVFVHLHKVNDLTMDSEDFPVVQIENGPVKGLKVKSVLNTEYFSFRGIPYMKAPLGKLRFREADSPRDWKEALDATQEGPSYCMTDFMTGVQDGQENAGTINIYSRSLKPGKLHPVMIWVTKLKSDQI